MEAKRFTAGDMRRALQMVREHLGPDAVILSSRKNIDGVEVVATNDYRIEDQEAEQVSEIVPVANKIYRQLTGVVDKDDMQIKNERVTLATENTSMSHPMESKKITTYEKGVSQRDANHRPVEKRKAVQKQINEKKLETELNDDFSYGEQEVPKYDVTQDITQMRYEMEGLRRMLALQQNNHLAATNATSQLLHALPNRYPELKQRLEWMGIPNTWHEKMLNDLPPGSANKEAWRILLQNIQGKIKVAPRDTVNAGGVHAFVGPTGAGKTTTIAKLATRFAMQHGVEQVGLISLDTHRVGGTQQLKTMGKLLGIPVRMVDNVSELEVSLRAFRSRSLVLIDTAGVRPGSAELNQMLKMLQVDPAINSFLVLPTTCQYPVMKTQLHCYKDVVKGLIITKLDESVSLGEAFATIIDSELPLVYTTDGQLIPESIALPNLHELLAMAVDKIKILHADGNKKNRKQTSGISDLYSK